MSIFSFSIVKVTALKLFLLLLGVVVHNCDPSIQEDEAGGSLQFRGQPQLYGDFKASLNCIMRPCLKNNNKTKPLFLFPTAWFWESVSIIILFNYGSHSSVSSYVQ